MPDIPILGGEDTVDHRGLYVKGNLLALMLLAKCLKPKRALGFLSLDSCLHFSKEAFGKASASDAS